jgi:hypothetical protein
VTRHIPQILLSLLVANLGIALGAGLFEARIVFPQWLEPGPGGALDWDAEASRSADTGRRFWAYVTTGPLTVLTLANLVAALRARGPRRRWWLGAVAIAGVERALTFGYFIPTMLALQSATGMSEAEAASTASQWGQLNQLRHVLTAAALTAALVALGHPRPDARASTRGARAEGGRSLPVGPP